MKDLGLLMSPRGHARPRMRALLSLVIVMSMSLTLFAPVRDFDMLLYDDVEHIVYNSHLVQESGSQRWHTLWTQPYFDLFIPLSYSLWALTLDHTVTPAEKAAEPLVLAQNQSLSRALHSLNLILHHVNVILVWALLTALGASWLGSGVGTLLFAVHPLQVESVAWISECRGLLAGALGLWAMLLLLIRWRMTSSADRGEGDRIQATSFVSRKNAPSALLLLMAWLSFSMSLLAKPSTVFLPILALIIGRLFFQVPWRRLLVEFTPFLLSFLVAALWTRYLQKDVLPLWPFWQRIAIAGDALAFYTAKLLWPSGLMADYGRQPDVSSWGALGMGYLPWLMLGFGWIRYRTKPHLILMVGIFILGLLPSLGFLPSLYQSVSTVADRYTYLALLGPALGIAWVLTEVFSWKAFSKNVPRNRILCGLFASLLVSWLSFLMVQTKTQLSHWRSTEALFTYNLSQNSQSYSSLHALGDLAVLQRDLALAEKRYLEASALRPAFAQPYASLGRVYLTQQKPDAAKVVLEKAVAINATDASAQLNYGVSLQRTGNTEKAIATYQKVNDLAPHPLAHYNLGIIYLQKKSWRRAEASFTEAMRLKPHFKEAASMLKRLSLLEKGP